MILYLLLSFRQPDLDYLHQVARQVVDGSKVYPGVSIPKGPKNETGYAIRVPGATQSWYPAFWVRDAAMMLGADLVSATEVEGWVRVVAKTQPGPAGIDFAHGLRIPPYSIPDHIALNGNACWFPGAYEDQGVGNYGFLPPADDAFYFVQMVHEQFRLTRRTDFLKSLVPTGYGRVAVIESAEKAFDSVAVDTATGLVVCSDEPGKGRVDWGFCDSIKKQGLVLMPSLLRWQAANRLAQMCQALDRPKDAKKYVQTAAQVRQGILSTFLRPVAEEGQTMMISATKLGKKDDIWASAFAVWLGVLPEDVEKRVTRHLLSCSRGGGILAEGQVRQMPVKGFPPDGEYCGYWESLGPGDSYQNGGYWATPTGWLAVALGKIKPEYKSGLLSEFVTHIKANRAKGAPFEWINPATGAQSNPNYGSSAGLVYVAIKGAR